MSGFPQGDISDAPTERAGARFFSLRPPHNNVGSVTIRPLSAEEALRFDEIDRSEVIEHVYYLREGRLVLEEERWELTGWPLNDLPHQRAHLAKCMDAGGSAWGAFDGDDLVGIAVLDGRWYGSARDILDLFFLHVGAGHRHRGLGKALVELVMGRAREMGARRLFVSGIPSENSIKFYRAMGFQLAEEVDPVLWEREPDDIHMDKEL